MTMLINDVYQGTRVSVERAMSGPVATPNMPTSPNNPMTSLIDQRH